MRREGTAERRPAGRPRAVRGPRAGLAIISVLLVLLALLALTAPFLMTARNAARASSELADRSQLALALDAAGRHARADLARSHPSVDRTPYYDDADELAVDADLAREFVDTHDATGVMWDARALDVAGEIDLNSASPHVFANLLGASTRLLEPLAVDGDSMQVSSTAGFEPTGFVWVDGEVIGYGVREPQAFKGLARGLASARVADGEPPRCGPSEAQDHAPGTPVIDQRAYAPVEWRNRVGDGVPRRFDAPEELRAASALALAGLSDGAFDAWDEPCSAFAGVRAGREWQRAARLANPVHGGVDCRLALDSARWFAPGTTVQISGGRTTELGVVLELGNQGVQLMEPLVNDYHAYEAEVRPLARRPVNVNAATAATLEALFANLQLAGINERITRQEARELAALVVRARPFDGFEDLLTRVLLPAGGIEAAPEGAAFAASVEAPVIDAYDALAAYENALNANSSHLAYSTMPLCFTSREVFDLELAAVVNAASGVERGRGRRRQVELVVPQEELLAVFARQEDFDELLRLDGEAPWWSTGPANTSRWDDGAVPPSRYAAHIGSFRGEIFVPGISPDPEDWTEESPPTPERVFASREDVGWAQLWPSRVAEVGALEGKVLHFDHETRDPEGRYLQDEIVALDTEDEMLAWTAPDDPLLRCVSLSLWIEPQELAPGVLVDVGASSLEADRVTLAFEEGELVLSVLDAMGDQSTTPDFREGLAARYALAPGGAGGGGAGLPAGVWTHVAIDVRGNRPDQVSLRVDGRTLGVRQTGLSRLASGVTAATTVLELEDGEMFPERGVVRIGREWIEYQKAGPDVLDCNFYVDDPVAPYTGGRYARLPFIGGAPDPRYLGLIAGAYPAGTPVELAGYTKPLRSQVSPATATLPELIGPFRVAYVSAVIGGLNPNGDDIVHQASGSNIGPGLDAKSTATALAILPADDPGAGAQALSEAFHQFGGYAALVQYVMEGTFTDALGIVHSPPHLSNQGGLIGGVEIIRYSSFDGTELQIAERAAIPAIDDDKERHAFVKDWTNVDFGNGKEDWLQSEIFVVPLSIPIGAASADFPSSYPNRSELAQITHVGSEIGQTEWVRYDSVANGHLVRHASAALEALAEALVIGGSTGVTRLPDDPAPPSGGGGFGQKLTSGASPPGAPAAGAVASPAAPQGQGPVYWDPYLGQEEPDEAAALVSRAAASALHFRGVFGTYGHEHPASTPVLPTFRVDESGFQSGWPGRGDSVLLVDLHPEDPGWPALIHHTWRPTEHTVYAWDEVSLRTPAAGNPVSVEEDGELLGFDYIGLEEASPVPIAPALEGSGAPEYETRTMARMLKYPSGERPRIADRLVVGGDLRGSPPPAVVIDELAFGTIELGASTDIGMVAQGAPLILAEDLADGGERLRVYPGALLLPSGPYTSGEELLTGLPVAGLLRVGSEILCYEDYNATSGELLIATDGRGLLGTAVEHHPEGSAVAYLEDLIVTTLAADVSAASGVLPILDAAGFPTEGTVLVDDELVHYTRIREGALEMPQASTVPGAMDGQGGGLFRGRFGTTPADHRQGAPVMLFPFRYWDRQAEHADGPELAYFGLAVDQPGAFWRSVFWDADEVEGSEIYALERAVDLGRGTAPPWDGDPERGVGLVLYETGMHEGGGIPIERQADRLEWRFFVRYLPGAFDAADGLSHAWKRTPRLELLGVEYLAPNQVLWRMDQ